MTQITTTPQYRAREIHARAQQLVVDARKIGAHEVAKVAKAIDREFDSSSLTGAAGTPADVEPEDGTPAERLAAIQADVRDLRTVCDGLASGPTRGAEREPGRANGLSVAELGVLLKQVERV
jgi:hypothetical protein